MMSLTFAVHRKAPLLVRPEAPTPRETKRLSDIDDQEILRRHVRFVFFYRGGGGDDDDRDPAGVIRRAVGEALVPYYPVAGRVREGSGGKLVVDCTGEGVLFVEADADVRLAELEAAGGLRPPFPCMDQLLFDVEGSSGVLNCPLLLIQVTRLLCGGFVLAIRFNHTICDATGLAQFMSAVAEHARGLTTPTVTPVWSRELLEARRPPNPAFAHPEFKCVPRPLPPGGDMVMRTFTFGSADVTAIKKRLPPRLQNTATSFEALTATLWRARTAALEIPPDEAVRLAVVVNVRKLPGLMVPAGYYGNAFLGSVAVTTAGALLAGSLSDAVALVQKAKASVTAEYVWSVIDLFKLLQQAGRTTDVNLGNVDAFVVSDVRHVGIYRLDFGWGEPVYSGPAYAISTLSHIVAVKDGGEEDAVAVPVVLPQPAMDRFASELENLFKSC